MKNGFGILLGLALLAVSCGGEWTDRESGAVACDFSEMPSSSVKRLSISSDGEDLYVLDKYGSVYRFVKNPARTCAFELARTPENSDGKVEVSMAQEIDAVGSYLYYYDGISLLRSLDEDWSCDISTGTFGMTVSNIYAAGNSGLKAYRVQAKGCVTSGVSFAAMRVMALDARSDLIAAVETAGALSDSPERLVLYRSDGSAEMRAALSADTASSLHFCSATRVKLGPAFIALLDSKCGTLGVFNLSGGLLHRLELATLGIRNPIDIDLVGNDLYVQTSSTMRPLYWLDFATFAIGEESL